MSCYRVLRQFTKSGASVIHPDVARHIWELSQAYSNSDSEETLEPDALFHLIFKSELNNSGNNVQIVRGGIANPDAIQNKHPDTTGNSFQSDKQVQQQKLMLPPPPPGSFKKIIAHPTRTMLTVPTNFDPDVVKKSSQLPNYDCSM
mgnify:CR=1 FL=1